MSAKKAKASDKQGVCKKLVTVLKKRYKATVPRDERSVLETLIYAVCLENAHPDQADAAYEKLFASFHDLNEVRVSSITELSAAFQGVDEPDLRAAKLRDALQHVFEKHYAFDLEKLKRKTLEQAVKQLEKIRYLSDFVRNYTLSKTMGSHLVPVDDRMAAAAVWLGLADADETPAQIAEGLKPVLRKSDAPVFCHLLRQAAVDPELAPAFARSAKGANGEELDLTKAPERLAELFRRPKGKPARKQTPTKKAAGKASSTKKKAAKKKTKSPAPRKKSKTAR